MFEELLEKVEIDTILHEIEPSKKIEESVKAKIESEFSEFEFEINSIRFYDSYLIVKASFYHDGLNNLVITLDYFDKTKLLDKIYEKILPYI